MKQLTFILSIAVLTIINGCSKQNVEIPKDTVKGDRCGTIQDLTWTQKLTIDSLVGNWVISGITYARGIGQKDFDTSYNAAATLMLNNDGTGMLNNSSINWSLATPPNSLPVLTFTNFETLFPFPVYFIQNGRIETMLERMPNTTIDSKIFISVQKTTNGLWEAAYMNFVRK
jgi:hypothetical protein